MVEEEQLPVRLQLPAGNEDTTDVTGLDTDENGPNTVTNVIVGTFSSSLSFTGNDGPVAYSFLPVLDGTQVLKTDGGNLTSQGANVLFALSGGMLIGYVDVGAAGYVDGIDRQVFTVELNQPADGQYRFTLLDNLDHHAAATADDVENIIGINLNNRVLVLDTGDPGDIEPIANFSINVIDDVPVAEPNTRTVPVGTLQTVDVQLIVDISGSMVDDVGDVPDFSDNRIGLARFSLREFLTDNIQIQKGQFLPPWPAVALGLPGSSTIAAKHAAAVRCTIAGAPGHEAMESSRRCTSDWTHSVIANFTFKG